MTRIVVASFWVDRPKDFPRAAPYLKMLGILDASCKRHGYEHVVLTDNTTSRQVSGAGLCPYLTDLPRNLMQAFTLAQARWLESPYSNDGDTIFVGADCIIRRDFRRALPEGDIAIAYMKGHKMWRLNNGFIYVPRESRERVAPLMRLVADDTGERICDDMLALERALVPMPEDYGIHERRGLLVNFLPMKTWNHSVKTADDPAPEANVLHFMGGWHAMPTGKIKMLPGGKDLFFDWAARHLPAAA